MKLRLLLTSICNRHCVGCCNKDWNLLALSKCVSYKEYDEIILTGGEPLIYPHKIRETVAKIRKQSDAKIFLYTAKTNTPETLLSILRILDGLTVTLHDTSDIKPFNKFNDMLQDSDIASKSLRLNIFKEVPYYRVDSYGWIVKKDIVWIENCPLPKDEKFMREY